MNNAARMPNAMVTLINEYKHGLDNGFCLLPLPSSATHSFNCHHRSTSQHTQKTDNLAPLSSKHCCLPMNVSMWDISIMLVKRGELHVRAFKKPKNSDVTSPCNIVEKRLYPMGHTAQHGGPCGGAYAPHIMKAPHGAMKKTK
jgi:hypothetical protein